MALFAIQRAKYAFSHPILYAVGAAVFLALSIITMSNFIFGHYYFIYRDLTWPTDNRDLFSNLFYSVDLESMRRTIYLGPIFAVVKLLGISSLDAEKLMFVLVRFLTGFLAFFSIYKFIQLRTRSENQPRKNSALFAIAIAGGFLYAYNPISTTMVAPTLGFAFAFAMIPPSFYFFDKSLQQRKSHDVIIASLFITLAIAGTIQYLVLLPVLLLVPWFAFSAVISAKRGLLKQTVMTFSQIVALIIVFSLYWILPAIISNLGGVPLEPQQYVVSTDFLNVVSQKLPLDKVIRLMGDWWPRIDNTPLFPVPAWNFLTFAIPVAMLSFVIFLRKSPIKFYVLLFVAIALWIAFFNKGTQPPFPSAYPSLFSIPLVGWMFRIPSKSAMILAFAATMAVSLGFYGVILQNRSSGIRKTLRLLLLPTFLVLVGILCWPMFTGDLGGVLADNKHQASAPIGPPNNILTTGLSDNNLAVVGGLDKLFLLEHVQNGNFSGRSILLLDQGVKTENILNFTNSVVVGTTPDDLLMHSIPANALVLSPFDYTNRYEPKQVFSLARTDYAINGSFPSSYLAKYSIHTQDLDFGKGLAFTRSDDTLDIPYSISQPGIYQVFVRTLESHQGGMMKIYSDKSLVKIIPTLARTDGFEWENLGAISYPSGKHVMSVESLRGINAINVIVLIPADNYQQMKQALAQRLANNTTQPVYELGVNDFTSKGSNIDQTILNPVKSDNSSNTYSGAIGIPKAASLMTLQLWVKPRSSSTSTSAVISDLSIAPTTTERILVHSHFESGGNVSEDFGYHPENLNVTIDSNAPLSGFKSLTARLSGSSNSNFGVLASGLVPLPTSHGFLSAGMFAATHDVDQLESQLVFYDHNRNPISQSTIFMTTADTQRTLFGKEIAVPENAAFVQLQFLSKMRPEPSSYYKLDVIILKQEFWDRPLSTEIFSESTPSEPRDTIQVGANDSAGLYIDNARDATPAWHLLESIPIDVTGDLQYRYGFHIDMRNVDSEFARFVYMSDPVQKATAASIEDTSEPVLAIPKDTQISSSLGVLKSGNYTFGILAKACGINCTTRLGVNTGDSNASETIRLTGQSETYTWYYFSKYLPAGDTNLTITSTGGQALFQGIIVVPAGSKNLLSTFNSTSSASELVKGFAESSMNQDNQARIVSYQTNNPVSYHAIVNASKPFLLNLELPYGSMWRAYADGRTYSPEKIYSPGAGISSLVESAEFPATNGFLIDKTGQLGITVKFLPHDLFEDGLGITIAGLTASFGYILWSRLRTTRNSADNFSEYNQSADHYIGTQIGRMKERLGIWEIVGLGSLVSLVALSVLFSLGYDNDSVSNGTMTLVYFLLIASVGGQLASIFFRRNHHANGSSSKQR